MITRYVRADELEEGDVLAEASLRYHCVEAVRQWNGWVEVKFAHYSGSAAFDNDRRVELAVMNRTCKVCGADYHDPGGKVEDPARHCPKCGSRAWFAGPGIS